MHMLEIDTTYAEGSPNKTELYEHLHNLVIYWSLQEHIILQKLQNNQLHQEYYAKAEFLTTFTRKHTTGNNANGSYVRNHLLKESG